MVRYLLPARILVALLLCFNPLLANVAWGDQVQTTTNEFTPPKKPSTALTEKAYGKLIDKVAKRRPHNRHILRGIVHVESRGDPNALNPKTKATGLTQIIPLTQEYMGCGPIEDPEPNLRCADRYLNYLCDKLKICRERAQALAFRLGPTGAQKAEEKDPWVLFKSPYVIEVTRIALRSRGG